MSKSWDDYADGWDNKTVYIGIMTSYRQPSIATGWFLMDHGPTKASQVAQNLREPKARDIMYKDVYGWFERESSGVYKLPPRGGQELSHWEEKPDTDSEKTKNKLEQTVK